MQFSDIIGQEFIKKHLTASVDGNRVAHAQLFVGKSGSGVLPMSIAFAQYLICSNADGENTGGPVACNAKFKHLSHPDLHFAFPVATTETVKNTPFQPIF